MIRGKDYKLNLYEGDEYRSASASCKQNWPIHVKKDEMQKILEINMEIDELDATQRTDHHLHAEYDDLPGIHDAQNEESMFLKPKSFADFINSKGFAEKINGVVDKTGGQLFLMILKYSITNNLPISAITNLYKMINSMHQTPVLPDSKYFLEKILNPKSGVEFHAVCSYCSSYLGEFSTEVPINDICDLCKKKEDVSQACKDNFFVLIKPDKQVKHLLEKYEDHYDYVMNKRKPNDDFIEDIYDGIMYKKLRENVKEEFKNQYVSAVFNTDGAPKFESSNKSIWPLYLMLNELPKQDRLNNIICCGLWFNKKKPDMAIYLQKFVDMFNSIDPISCIIKSKNLFIKPYISSCCVDAPARAAVQGLIQYNGYLGCNWCLHPGFQSGTMLYPIVHPAPIPRTHEQIFEVMYNFDKNEENEFGIKYPSPLICLLEFDMVRGLTPDYMHMALEGVAKQMMNYYMSSIGDNDMEQLDLIMEKIAVPKQIKRYTRPISVRKDWKAREWENFTLYYSVPILKPLLSRKKYLHWLKFVEGVY